LSAFTAAIVVSLALSQPAGASCITLPPLDEALAAAPMAFVGTVVETKHDGRTAMFEVEGSLEGVGWRTRGRERRAGGRRDGNG
jgi:hypothetical protein